MTLAFTVQETRAMARQLLSSGNDIEYDFARLTNDEKACFGSRDVYEKVHAKCFVLLKNDDQAWIIDNIIPERFETLEAMEENL